jgi:hypothetical protein
LPPAELAAQPTAVLVAGLAAAEEAVVLRGRLGGILAMGLVSLGFGVWWGMVER